jgi:HAD superfamily hydrolase (TIGR01509 family)
MISSGARIKSNGMANTAMGNPKVKAVLFDLDGTIVQIDWDLEFEMRIVREFAHKRKITVENEGINEAIAEVRFKLKHERDRKEYMRKLFELESKMIDERGVGLCGGAKEIVRAVKFARIKTAIVSNNFHEDAARVLEKFGLLEYFDQLVCYDDVLAPKPSPEGINEALRRLKVKPSEALFVGDGRVTDLEAAQSAGVDSVIIDHGKIADEKERILGRV